MKIFCTICVLYTSKSFCDNHKQKKFCVSKKKRFLISVQEGALDQRNDAMCGGAGVLRKSCTRCTTNFLIKKKPTKNL